MQHSQTWEDKCVAPSVSIISEVMPGEQELLVYYVLYNVSFARRFQSDWMTDLKMQKHAMSKLLSFVLRPCVDRIHSFIKLGDAGRVVP